VTSFRRAAVDDQRSITAATMPVSTINTRSRVGGRYRPIRAPT
jgi:hypothetical protein